jgi:L-malate glycosyltransferase
MTSSPLTIFVPHCSDLLTDHLPHGDGLIAHGFLTNLARRGHRLHVASSRVDLREPLHQNITLYAIPVTSASGLLSRVEYMIRVRALWNKLKQRYPFDLIHQFNPVFTGISLFLALSKLPLVLGTYVARWPDDPDSLASAQRWHGQVLRTCRTVICFFQQRQADALLVTTPAACDRLPGVHDLGGRIQLLPHGVDAEFFSPQQGWDSPAAVRVDQNRPSILFFANVLKRKGIFTLLDAFSKLSDEFPSLLLRIAGDGNAFAEVKRRASTLCCAGKVEFLGRQQRSEAPALYRSSSIYCLPSYGEPYATTVLEAMSCARPLVVTNAGGLAHMVHDRGGIRVPVGDPTALAAALGDLLRNPDLRVSMGRYNRALVEDTMTWAHVTQRLEEIYSGVLARRGAQTHPSGRVNVSSWPRSSTVRLEEQL